MAKQCICNLLEFDQPRKIWVAILSSVSEFFSHWAGNFFSQFVCLVNVMLCYQTSTKLLSFLRSGHFGTQVLLLGFRRIKRCLKYNWVEVLSVPEYSKLQSLPFSASAWLLWLSSYLLLDICFYTKCHHIKNFQFILSLTSSWYHIELFICSSSARFAFSVLKSCLKCFISPISSGGKLT